jgi:lipid II:glycine glycyltransferase (peptidoglycan interpeptide bridge formation enzyme)
MSEPVTFRDAGARELEAWDDLTVHVGGGHVLQSRAWADYRSRHGWRPRFLVGSDGSAVLVLLRPWPLIGGSSAYVSRGPIPAGGPDEMAARLAGLTGALAASGVDVVAADAEVEASTGYAARLDAIGFHPIEEIQPSRHRLALSLGQTADEEGVLAGIAKSTRQRIRKAEGEGIVVVRHDLGEPTESGPGAASAASSELGEGFAAPSEPFGPAIERFADFMAQTGERRHFWLAPTAQFLDWAGLAHAAGHLVLLEARMPDGEPLAGLVLYRHGGRLSTAFSGDADGARQRYPGVFHLLRWRAIQLAIRERRAEMDLGGVDVAGARHEPREGEPMYGLYEHKRSFGARWVELTGAHERVIRPARYLAGRVAARLVRR